MSHAPAAGGSEDDLGLRPVLLGRESGAAIFLGRLPDRLRLDAEGFERLWALHPARPHEVTMYGRRCQTPRWQQAFGADYVYSGNVARAKPTPPILRPLWRHLQDAIDPRLNGILVNWYDGALGHYMGPHRDTTGQLISGAPIVTVSFGQERVFRLRPRGVGAPTGSSAGRDLLLSDGDVLVLPFETNRIFTHAVPRLARHRDRRISVTLRAFRQLRAEGPGGEPGRPGPMAYARKVG